MLPSAPQDESAAASLALQTQLADEAARARDEAARARDEAARARDEAVRSRDEAARVFESARAWEAEVGRLQAELGAARAALEGAQRLPALATPAAAPPRDDEGRPHTPESKRSAKKHELHEACAWLLARDGAARKRAQALALGAPLALRGALYEMLDLTYSPEIRSAHRWKSNTMAVKAAMRIARTASVTPKPKVGGDVGGGRSEGSTPAQPAAPSEAAASATQPEQSVAPSALSLQALQAKFLEGKSTPLTL